jgi:DNA-directed RNA polymerase specialized sigma subunit
MPGQFKLPQVGSPTQPTGGPKPPKPEFELQPSLALEPQYQYVYDMWKNNPSPETNDEMLRAVKPVIDSALKTYGGAGQPILKSKAKKIFVDSLHKYDPTATKLKTYIFNQLQGIKRLSLQQNQIINIPEQVQLDYAAMSRSEQELAEKLGRDPSTEELADHTNMSVKRISYIRKMRMPASEGLMSKIQNASGMSEYNDPSIKSNSGASAWLDFVYSGMGDIDKLIMEHSFGLYGKSVLSNQKIASKLGISPAAVSIRRSKIQAELDKRSQLNLL